MNKFTLTIVPLLLISHIYAGCGGCGPRKSQETVQKGLLETIPRNNYLKGDVLMSCGMCNFNTDENDCRLAIKVGRYVLPVKDVSIDAHGDSHARDGYCNVIKKAYVEGSVRGNKFYPDKLNPTKI